MEEDTPFRSSYVELVPPAIPLAATVIAVLMGFFTFFKDCDLNELPIQYASAAIWIAVGGLCFSFYVPVGLSLDSDLDFEQENGKWQNELRGNDHFIRIGRVFQTTIWYYLQVCICVCHLHLMSLWLQGKPSESSPCQQSGPSCRIQILTSDRIFIYVRSHLLSLLRTSRLVGVG